jgi:DNA-directed RNA polymerase specialized sigma24 family protein
VAQGSVRITPEDAAAVAAKVDVTDLAERIGLRAVQVIAELRDTEDRDLEQLTVEAAMSNVYAVLRGFAAAESADSAQAPEPTLNWVSTLAQRGIAVAAIPRCYVVGLGLCDAALREAVYHLGVSEKAKWQLTNAASEYLFRYCEKVSGDLVDHYARERELWVRGADSLRAELVTAIVSGRPVDPHVSSAALEYNLDRPHVAVVVWSDPHSPDKPPLQALKRAAAEVARHLKGIELLVVPGGASMVWAWTSGPVVTDLLPEGMHVDMPMMAAVGGVGHGLDGFVQSHRQARDGRRMSGVFSLPPGTVTVHRDVALDALVTRDLSAAGVFVRAELGELSSDSERNRRLRATLTAYFEEGQSWGRTAERLGVHQNTVMYRVQQAKELLGRPLNERRLELEVALRLAEASRNLSPGALASAGLPDPARPASAL